MTQLAEESSSSPATSKSAILRARDLSKSFRMGDSQVQVLQNAELSVHAGEFVAIEGRSGSGKSTLLHLLGALDEPDTGAIEFEGKNLRQISSANRSTIRNTRFGFVFQFYHLLPELNVLENTLLAAMVQHSWFGFQSRKRDLKARAGKLLSDFGLQHRLKHRPAQLSGGERQRVAIARALMNNPAILYADEPTGNLDFDTGRQIMGVLERLHRERNQTIIMVTHDRTLARQADRVLVLKEGKLSEVQ